MLVDQLIVIEPQHFSTYFEVVVVPVTEVRKSSTLSLLGPLEVCCGKCYHQFSYKTI